MFAPIRALGTRFVHGSVTQKVFAGLSQQTRQKHYVLMYDYVDDIMEKRGPHREAHLDAARKLRDEGKVLFAGPMMDPVDKALFMFDVEDKQEIEDFVKADPYFVNGLVPSYEIREYNMVIS